MYKYDINKVKYKVGKYFDNRVLNLVSLNEYFRLIIVGKYYIDGVIHID